MELWEVDKELKEASEQLAEANERYQAAILARIAIRKAIVLGEQ